MGIVNAQQVEADKYELIDKELLEFVEDVLLNRQAFSYTQRSAAHTMTFAMQMRTTNYLSSVLIMAACICSGTTQEWKGCRLWSQVRECDREATGVRRHAGAQVQAHQRQEAWCGSEVDTGSPAVFVLYAKWDLLQA